MYSFLIAMNLNEEFHVALDVGHACQRRRRRTSFEARRVIADRMDRRSASRRRDLATLATRRATLKLSAHPPEDRSARGTESPCRLLYLAGELHKGGLERQLDYLLRSMDRERYTPAVAVWNYRESDLHVPLIRALGVPIYSLGTASSRIAKLSAFRRLVKQLEPEVVHSCNFYTNFAAVGRLWGTRR